MIETSIMNCMQNSYVLIIYKKIVLKRSYSVLLFVVFFVLPTVLLFFYKGHVVLGHWNSAHMVYINIFGWYFYLYVINCYWKWSTQD